MGGQAGGDPLDKRVSGWRDKIVDLLILGVPLALGNKLIDWLVGSITDQPYQAMWVLLPLALAVWIGWQALRRRRAEFQLSRPYLVCLGLYVLFFSVAASTSVLDWSRDLTVFGRDAGRSWLTPVSLGDWRYRLVRKKPLERSELAVVLMEPGEGTTARNDIIRLISMAAGKEARGVALDFYFEEEMEIDPLLCSVIDRAGIPVLTGYGFTRLNGHIQREPLPQSLLGCLPEERQGHPVGFRDHDLSVRIVPLHFQNDPERPALSLRVAREFDAEVGTPDSGLLRFVEPERGYPVVSYQDLVEKSELRDVLTDRFVFVGERSKAETFQTPFGEKYGVVIHADSAHSLLSGTYLERAPWWFSLLLIYGICYLLAAQAAQGASWKRLALFCLAVSGAVIALAVLGVVIGNRWFDVIYVLAAVWGLFKVLLLYRKLARA